MNRTRHVAVVGAVFALVLAAFAGTAGADIPRMGDQRVGLFACAFPGPCADSSLVANEAFFVAHGVSLAETPFTWEALVNPETRFELWVDGIQQHGAIEFDNPKTQKVSVFNFPTGMRGTHSFTGFWYLNGALLGTGTRIVHFE
jgi:hypothetical protein